MSIGCSLWSLRTTMYTLPLCINHYQFYVWFAHITRICRSPPTGPITNNTAIPRHNACSPRQYLHKWIYFCIHGRCRNNSSVGFGIKKSLEIFWWCRLECEDVNAALIHHCYLFWKKKVFETQGWSGFYSQCCKNGCTLISNQRLRQLYLNYVYFCQRLLVYAFECLNFDTCVRQGSQTFQAQNQHLHRNDKVTSQGKKP